MSFLRDLRRRKVVQWTAAYLAGAWIVMQLLDVLGPRWGMGDELARSVDILLAGGLGIVLVVSWFHGEKGHQRVGIAEAGLLGGLLLATGVGVTVSLRGADAGGGAPGESGEAAIHDEREAPVPGARTLAVLPFTNVSADPEQEYFSDGLTEELLTVLARIPGLQVASRTSSFAFKGQAVPPEEVARRLRVSRFVEGSVRRYGDRLRVSAQLIEVESGFELWNGSYDEPAGDWLEIQDRIARAIGSALEVELAEDLGIAGRTTRDPEAHDLYLQGRAAWRRRSVEDQREALALFEQALARDSTYALAWAGLADTYLIFPFYSRVPTGEVFPAARSAAERALEIDPGLVEARTTLAYLRALFDHDLEASDRAFARVLEDGSWYATALKWYSDILTFIGRDDQALEVVRRAVVLDPASANNQTILGMKFLVTGDQETALEYFDRALQLDPDFPLTLKHASWVYWSRGDTARFFHARERLESMGVPVEAPVAEVRAAYQEAGPEATMRLMADAPGGTAVPMERARWRALLGDLDGAFESIYQAREVRDVWYIFVTYYPELEAVRRDPRYEEVVAGL
jgi:TolB-like protein/Tfp pilus assembly protein PilF